jgi:tetratricopeptide (TPR) repeat protein
MGNLCGGGEREKTPRTGKSIKEHQAQTWQTQDLLNELRNSSATATVTRGTARPPSPPSTTPTQSSPLPLWLTQSMTYMQQEIDRAKALVDQGNENDAICKYQNVIDHVHENIKINNVVDTPSPEFTSLMKFKARAYASIGYVYEHQLKFKVAVVQYKHAYSSAVSIDTSTNHIDNFILLGRISENIGKVIFDKFHIYHAAEDKANAVKWIETSEDWFHKSLHRSLSDDLSLDIHGHLEKIQKMKNTLMSFRCENLQKK